MINTNVSKEDKSLMNKVLLRSFTLECSFNYEKMQALGFAYSMMPVIKKYYKTDEERAKALQRHMGFFNTTPAMSPFIMGISSAMEKKNAEEGNVEDSSINGIKVGLMGPLAGVGDSFFWGTFRVIAAGIGIQFAQQGSILGALLFLLLFNIPHLAIRYFGIHLGFGFGTKILESVNENGIMDKVSKCATIVGLMVVGAMTFSMVNFSTPLVLNIGQTTVEIQSILNQILPGLLPLLLTLFCFKKVKKGTNVNLMLLLMVIIGIVGKYLGIL